MKKIIELKVTEICQISQTFNPSFDCPITTLLLVIGNTPVGDEERIIIPTKEAEFKTDTIVVGGNYRFNCYKQRFVVRDYYDEQNFSGRLCLKVMDV